MPAFSAPSAKMATFRSLIVFMLAPFEPALFNDPRSRVRQRSELYGRCAGEGFAIAITDQDGATTSPSTGLYIAPTIAHHEAAGKVQAKPLSGTEYHAGFRLAAVALFVVIVLANLYRVERQNGGKLRIEFVNVGLI